MNLTLVQSGLLVGMVGDFFLQQLDLGDKGLKSYFTQHGQLESIYIAGGMMSWFSFLYSDVLRLPKSYIFIAFYGMILDGLFRKFRWMKSLDEYYKNNDYYFTLAWGAIPFIITLFMEQNVILPF